MAVVNEDLAAKMTGRKPRKEFPVLDARILEHADVTRILREDVKQNSVRYEFPAGLNDLDLFEEISALAIMESGTIDERTARLYDISMQMLVDKDVVIKVKKPSGEYIQIACFHVTDRYMNLHGVDAIATYPTLILWMCEEIGESLIKKFPLPATLRPESQAASEKQEVKTGRTKGKTSDR